MRYRRLIYPGGVYFFTINLRDRKSSLLISHIDELRQSFKKVQLRYPFKLPGIVILPEYLHMLMELPDGDSNYSLCLSLIKRYFSMQLRPVEYINEARVKKRERGIWQHPFWEHLIRDDLDYERHMNYILYNPVKHGYVTKPSDWPFSSIHRDIRLGKIPLDWACANNFSDGHFGENDLSGYL